MKTQTKYCLIAAAAAVALAACSGEETVDNMDNGGPVEARFAAGIGAPATRAVGYRWNADHIGIMVTAPENMKEMYRNVEYVTASTGFSADFSPAETGGGIFFQNKTGQVTFSAYAPYQQSSAGNVLPGTDGVIGVNTADSNGDTQESIDFLFASGATASQQSPDVYFSDESGEGGKDNSFHHMMAMLDIVFQVSAADGFSAADILAEGNTFKLGGLMHEGTFNVTDGTAAPKTGIAAVDDWDITSCKHTDTTGTRTYSLILLPQDLTGSPLEVSVVIGGQTYSNNTDITPDLEAGKMYTYTITVKKTGLAVSGCGISAWETSTTGSGSATM